MHRMFGRLLFWIAILSIVGMFFTVTAQELPTCTITVSHEQSIQKAIDRAPDGAVICLGMGEWRENIIITKNLTLRGVDANTSIIRGKVEKLPVVHVNSPLGGRTIQVVIEQVTVTRALGPKANGVVIDGVAQATITNCTIKRNQATGIYVANSAKAIIQNCSIEENTWAGIWVWHSAQADITDCKIENNKHDGIYVWCSAQAYIVDCVVKENDGDGIYILDSAQAKISGTLVQDNEWDGIDIWGSAKATIQDCIIQGHDDGIWIWSNAQAIIEGSIIKENLRGICMRNSAQVDIRENQVISNKTYGVIIGETPFNGYVTGSLNIVPGAFEAYGNAEAAVYPNELAFLMTKEGGTLDQRY